MDDDAMRATSRQIAMQRIPSEVQRVLAEMPRRVRIDGITFGTDISESEEEQPGKLAQN